MKKLVKVRKVTIVLLLILIAFITKAYLFNRYEFRQHIIKQDMDSTKKMIENNSVKVKRIVESISNQVEIVVLNEKGKIEIFHDKTPENNKYIEWMIDSNITLKIYYTAILTINVENIKVSYDEEKDIINIIYDLDKISIRSINIDNILLETSHGIFGQKYSPKEFSTLTFVATNKIKEELCLNDDIKYIAGVNLEKYLKDLSYDLRVFNVSVIKD